MGKLMSIIFLVLLSAADGNKYLDEIPLYGKISYYKEGVYNDHDYKSFYALKEANAVVNPADYDMHLLGAAVFYATNKLRTEKKLKPLKYSAALRDAAAVHTWQMVSKNFFSHYNNKNRKIQAPDQRLTLFGIPQTAIGENCDLNSMFTSDDKTYIQLAEEIVDNLYHSPEHKKIMLSKDYNALGCSAIFESQPKKGAWYCKTTQDFAKL